MADPNFGAIHENADHVEAIRLRFPPVPIDPDHRGTLQLLALPVVNGLNRPAKLRPSPSFDLDERDGSIPLNNQIDVAMTVPKAPLDDFPSASPKPPLRYSLSELTERLPGR